MLRHIVMGEEPMLLPVSLTLTAIAAFINLWLAIRVGKTRMSEKVLHGDGGCPPLAKRMRAQANFIEYTPIILILFALVEMAFGTSSWLWLLAFVYAFARIAHAFGMEADKPHPARAAGIMITFLVTIILAIAALYAAYGSMRALEAPPSFAARA